MAWRPKNENFKLRPYQVDDVVTLLKTKKIMLAADTGTGKAQPLTTPVLTPKGYKPMGSIKVGSWVIGSNGLPTRVTGVFRQGLRPVFRVKFTDGSSTLCCDEHLWSTQTPVNKQRGDGFSVKQLSEIREDLFDTYGNKKHYIPITQPVHFDWKYQPIEPYAFGMLLGDGGFTDSKRISFTTADEELLQAMRKSLKPLGLRVVYCGNEERPYGYLITGQKGTRGNALRSILNACGLLGKYSHEKHIPKRYLYGSIEQRIALLQGLLDTDGGVNKQATAEFYTSSEKLCDDVRFLVESLGGVARKRGKPVDRYRTAYTLTLNLPNIIPFRLLRKVELYEDRIKYGPSRGIVSVEPEGKALTQCISVESEDQLYLTEHCIVTHNTCSYIRAAERALTKGRVNAWFIFCPAATVVQVANEIKRLTDSRVIMLTGTAAQRKDKRTKARRDNIKYVVMPMSVTVWNERNQVLKLMDYRRGDNEVGIIIDEAYYLKSGPVDVPNVSKTAKRVKAMFGMREAFKYRFCVTGTPVQNSPEDAYWIFFFLHGKKLLGGKEDFDREYIIKDGFGNPRGVRNLEKFHAIIKPYMIRRKETDPEVAKYLPKMITENIEITPEEAAFRKMYAIIRRDTMEALEALARFGPADKLPPDQREMKNNILRQAQSRAATLQMLCVGGTEVIKRHALGQIDKNIKLVEQDKKPKKTYALRLYKRHKDMFAKTTVGEKPGVLVEMVKEILREDPEFKIVIFSHYRHAADIIFEELTKAKLKTRSHMDDGTIMTVPVNILLSKGGQNEQFKKDAFNNDVDTRVLITTDANREGVDLPAGSHLFHADMPYNHAIWHQRSTRIRRTGSKHKRVRIFNLLLEGTVEMRVWEHILRTKAMSAAIVDGKKHKRDVVEIGNAKKKTVKAISGLKLHESTLYSFIKNDGFEKDLNAA